MKKWYKTKTGKVNIAGLMGMKKVTISTTIPNNKYQFAKTNGLKFSYILSNGIGEYMNSDGDFKTKKEYKELLNKWITKFTRLQKHLIKIVGEEKTAEFIKESEYIEKVNTKLKEKGL